MEIAQGKAAEITADAIKGYDSQIAETISTMKGQIVNQECTIDEFRSKLLEKEAKSSPKAAAKPPPQSPADIADRIRVLRDKLMSEGLGWKKIQDHAEIKELILRLRASGNAETRAHNSNAKPKAKWGIDKRGRMRNMGDDEMNVRINHGFLPACGSRMCPFQWQWPYEPIGLESE